MQSTPVRSVYIPYEQVLFSSIQYRSPNVKISQSRRMHRYETLTYSECDREFSRPRRAALTLQRACGRGRVIDFVHFQLFHHDDGTVGMRAACWVDGVGVDSDETWEIEQRHWPDTRKIPIQESLRLILSLRSRRFRYATARSQISSKSTSHSFNDMVISISLGHIGEF